LSFAIFDVAPNLRRKYFAGRKEIDHFLGHASRLADLTPMSLPSPDKPTERSAATRALLYRDAVRAAALGLVVNLLLGVAKCAAGWASGSMALLSDAVNSLGDALTSAAVLFAFRVAQRPPDAEHPYGHTRAEAIAASNVALLITVSALAVAFEASRRIMTPHAIPPAWTLWLAGANVLIKEGLYRYKIAVGRRTGSMAVIANAWDHRSDALCSLAVLVGLAVVRFGGPTCRGADEIAAIVVAAVIVYSGIRLFRQGASELMDVQADAELVEKVRRAAGEVEGVQRVEKLWIRKSGLEHFADIHVEVDPQMTVARGHEIGHQVKDRLLAEFSTLRDVLVHLEPYGHEALHKTN
jgi:cation diffusion facilitator family transporter